MADKAGHDDAMSRFRDGWRLAMGLPAPNLHTPERFFLGVEKSVCGLAWKDRLGERGSARALTIAQRHGLDELLARVLAGRGVEADQVEAFLDPTIKRLMPDPHTLTDMETASMRHAVLMRKKGYFGDYDVDGATRRAVCRYLRHCDLIDYLYS
jgi:single-stranded-DNA-specific exonuclease